MRYALSVVTVFVCAFAATTAAAVECASASTHVTGLRVLANKVDLTWDVPPDAATYEIEKGNLSVLRSSGGNFTTSLQACVENVSTDALTSDPAVPAAGGAFYYLVRYQDLCGGWSTFDEGASSQQGSRDAEIAASGARCVTDCAGENPASVACVNDVICFPGVCDHSFCIPSRCYCNVLQWVCSNDCVGKCT